MQPKYSIVIPAYNSALYIKECLQSVISQTYQNWEVILIDNHSTDATVSIAESFNDLRIKIDKVYNNGVIAISRNKGIEKSSGEYIAFLDSDDFWDVRKLEIVDAAFESCSADLICHNFWLLKNGHKTKKVTLGPYKNYSDLLLLGNCLSTSEVVVKKTYVNSVGGFSEKPEYITVEDYDFWLRLFNTKLKVSYINDALSCYRLHSGNASGTAEKYRKSYFNVLGAHLNGSKFSRDKVHKRYATAYKDMVKVYLDSRKYLKILPCLSAYAKHKILEKIKIFTL